MKNKNLKNIMGFTVANVALTSGALVTTSLGGSGAGFTAFSSMMPAVGTVMGGGMLLRATKGLQDSIKVKKRKR